jgi:hypothetical protein
VPTSLPAKFSHSAFTSVLVVFLKSNSASSTDSMDFRRTCNKHAPSTPRGEPCGSLHTDSKKDRPFSAESTTIMSQTATCISPVIPPTISAPRQRTRRPVCDDAVKSATVLQMAQTICHLSVLQHLFHLVCWSFPVHLLDADDSKVSNWVHSFRPISSFRAGFHPASCPHQWSMPAVPRLLITLSLSAEAECVQSVECPLRREWCAR